MHIVVTTLPLKRPLDAQEIARLEQELPSLAAGQHGYYGVYWARAGELEALTVSVWETEVDADAALQGIGPWLGALIGPLVAGQPERRIAEVLVADSRGPPV